MPSYPRTYPLRTPSKTGLGGAKKGTCACHFLRNAEGAGAMSVMEQLGVADMERGLAEARELWHDWVAQDRRLALAPAVDGLPDWCCR